MKYRIGLFIQDQCYETFKIIEGNEQTGQVINSVLDFIFKTYPNLVADYNSPHLAFDIIEEGNK
jgi:hypothetical protein